MKSHGFEEIDHTADLALRVWGENFHDLLLQAAKGLYHLLNVKAKEKASVRHSFSIEYDGQEAMLVDFLNELLYLCEEKKKIFHSLSFTEKDKNLNIEAKGKKLESIERNIKAVTFHDLEIRSTQTGLDTIVTFDV